MDACRSVVAGTVLTALLAGCGGGSDDSPRAADPPGAASVDGTPVAVAGEDPVPGEGIEVPPPPTPMPTGPVSLIEASRILPAAAPGWQDASDHVVLPCSVALEGVEGETSQRDFTSGERTVSQVVIRLTDPARAGDAVAGAIERATACGRAEFTDLGWVDVGEETRIYRARGTTTVLIGIFRSAGTVGTFVMADPPGADPEQAFAETVGRAFDPFG